VLCPINDYGFIESPYRRVITGKVVDEIRILNPGDTDFKVNQVMLLPAVEEANAKLGPGKQTAEFEAHSDYLSAWEEDKYIIAQANVGLDPEGNIVNDLVNARQAGNFVLKHRDEIEYMDVSPKQLVSVPPA
jgi:DNA-directed RNA polymerase subunit beta